MAAPGLLLFLLLLLYGYCDDCPRRLRSLATCQPADGRVLCGICCWPAEMRRRQRRAVRLAATGTGSLLLAASLTATDSDWLRVDVTADGGGR